MPTLRAFASEHTLFVESVGVPPIEPWLELGTKLADASWVTTYGNLGARCCVYASSTIRAELLSMIPTLITISITFCRQDLGASQVEDLPTSFVPYSLRRSYESGINQ